MQKDQNEDKQQEVKDIGVLKLIECLREKQSISNSFQQNDQLDLRAEIIGQNPHANKIYQITHKQKRQNVLSNMIVNCSLKEDSLQLNFTNSKNDSKQKEQIYNQDLTSSVVQPQLLEKNSRDQHRQQCNTYENTQAEKSQYYSIATNNQNSEMANHQLVAGQQDPNVNYLDQKFTLYNIIAKNENNSEAKVPKLQSEKTSQKLSNSIARNRSSKQAEFDDSVGSINNSPDDSRKKQVQRAQTSQQNNRNTLNQEMVQRIKDSSHTNKEMGVGGGIEDTIFLLNTVKVEDINDRRVSDIQNEIIFQNPNSHLLRINKVSLMHDHLQQFDQSRLSPVLEENANSFNFQNLDTNRKSTPIGISTHRNTNSRSRSRNSCGEPPVTQNIRNGYMIKSADDPFNHGGRFTPSPSPSTSPIPNQRQEIEKFEDFPGKKMFQKQDVVEQQQNQINPIQEYSGTIQKSNENEQDKGSLNLKTKILQRVTFSSQKTESNSRFKEESCVSTIISQDETQINKQNSINQYYSSAGGSDGSASPVIQINKKQIRVQNLEKYQKRSFSISKDNKILNLQDSPNINGNSASNHPQNSFNFLYPSHQTAQSPSISHQNSPNFLTVGKSPWNDTKSNQSPLNRDNINNKSQFAYSNVIYENIPATSQGPRFMSPSRIIENLDETQAYNNQKSILNHKQSFVLQSNVGNNNVKQKIEQRDKQINVQNFNDGLVNHTHNNITNNITINTNNNNQVFNLNFYDQENSLVQTRKIKTPAEINRTSISMQSRPNKNLVPQSQNSFEIKDQLFFNGLEKQNGYLDKLQKLFYAQQLIISSREKARREQKESKSLLQNSNHIYQRPQTVKMEEARDFMNKSDIQLYFSPIQSGQDMSTPNIRKASKSQQKGLQLDSEEKFQQYDEKIPIDSPSQRKNIEDALIIGELKIKQIPNSSSKKSRIADLFSSQSKNKSNSQLSGNGSIHFNESPIKQDFNQDDRSRSICVDADEDIQFKKLLNKNFQNLDDVNPWAQQFTHNENYLEIDQYNYAKGRDRDVQGFTGYKDNHCKRSVQQNRPDIDSKLYFFNLSAPNDRQKAYFSQHAEALQNFEQAIDLTRKQMKLINDQLLLAEWKKMETDIQAQFDIVIQLYNLNRGIQPQYRKPNSNKFDVIKGQDSGEMNIQDRNNRPLRKMKTTDQPPPQMNVVNGDQKAYPFNQKPFSYLHQMDMQPFAQHNENIFVDINQPGNQRNNNINNNNNMNMNNNFEVNNANPSSNNIMGGFGSNQAAPGGYSQKHQMRNNQNDPHSEQSPMTKNPFSNQYSNNSNNNNVNNNFPSRNANPPQNYGNYGNNDVVPMGGNGPCGPPKIVNPYQQFGNFGGPPQPPPTGQDPDVWDPPPKNSNNNNNQQKLLNNNNNKKQDPVKPTGNGGNNSKPVGAGAGPADKKRDYNKPWLDNAAPPKQEGKDGVGEDGKKQSYAQHIYGDATGPDTDLIMMIEKDMVDMNPNIKFEDIAELDKAKDILQEAVLLPILMPEFFQGIRRPWKGVLMFGPPGTGKTMLAQAVATMGKTTFFNVSAANLTSQWRGESEKLVRLLFEMARYHAPSTIFFDEFDALGAKRVDGECESNRRMKAEMLIQMDGVSNSATADGERKVVMVLAATNRPWDLDEALRRRLEKRIYIPLPSEEGRSQLFKLNLQNIKLADDIVWEDLIKKTEQYSGADITNVCRQAALMPMRRKLLKEGGFKNIGNIENLQKESECPLTINDFNQALKNVNQSVGTEDLQHYSKWMDEFGSV